MAFQLTTFFSYKGGAGRSTTCLNTIPFLAKECGARASSPLLLLDTDIESAGMTYLLDLADAFQEFDVKTLFLGDVQWTFSAFGNSVQDHPLYKYFQPVGNKFGLADNNAVMFLGVDDRASAERTSYVEGRATQSINNFKRFCRNNRIPMAVMDSASGDQLTAQMSSQNADNLVLCMRPTSQFRMGTFNYLRRLSRKSARNDDQRVIILPTVVPKDCLIDGEEQLKRACEDIKKFVDGINNLDICTDFTTEKRFGINEVTRFKWKETVLNKIKADNASSLTEDEKEAIERYSDLARIIVDD